MTEVIEKKRRQWLPPDQLPTDDLRRIVSSLLGRKRATLAAGRPWQNSRLVELEAELATRTNRHPTAAEVTRPAARPSARRMPATARSADQGTIANPLPLLGLLLAETREDIADHRERRIVARCKCAACEELRGQPIPGLKPLAATGSAFIVTRGWSTEALADVIARRFGKRLPAGLPATLTAEEAVEVLRRIGCCS